jgi:putative protein-disulfide isomerase
MRKTMLATMLAISMHFTGFSQTEKPVITYIFDPLCGWCYAFDLVMEELHQKYKNDLKFVVVSGGMVTGKNVKPMSAISEDILDMIPHLEATSGAKFGQPYIELLQLGAEVMDSEKPSRALEAFKENKPEDAFPFAYQIQKTSFWEGRTLNQDSTYFQLANKNGLDGKAFVDLMNSDKITKQTNENFKQVEKMGVHSFPTVFFTHNGKTHLLNEGYERFDKLEKKLLKILKSDSKTN